MASVQILSQPVNSVVTYLYNDISTSARFTGLLWWAAHRTLSPPGILEYSSSRFFLEALLGCVTVAHCLISRSRCHIAPVGTSHAWSVVWAWAWAWLCAVCRTLTCGSRGTACAGQKGGQWRLHSKLKREKSAADPQRSLKTALHFLCWYCENIIEIHVYLKL